MKAKQPRERTTGRSRDAAYYYVDGERVALSPAAEPLAFFAAVVESRGSSDAIEALLHAKPLRNGVSLADPSPIASAVVDELTRINARLPVFRFGAGLVIVLPEVRIEEQRPRKILAIQRWIDEQADRVLADGVLEIGRVTVRPRSGRGEDALEIANELHEHFAPELAQARFLRVVDRPGPAGH